MHKLKRSVKITGVIGLLGIIGVTTYAMNQSTVDLSLNGDPTVLLQTDDTYEDSGASASVSNSILTFLNKNLEVETSGSVDSHTNGVYTITYSAEYHNQKVSKERTVKVRDYVPPEITLNTVDGYYTPYNHTYEEEGYTAFDALDGDLTDQVHVIYTENYALYSVKDSQNNYHTTKRTITYDDREAPVITFHDDGSQEEVRVYVGDGYNSNFTASDDSDGDLTEAVEVSGTVDSSIIGDYVLTYTVSDSHDHTTSLTRTIHVVARPINVTGYEDSKTIYLTFDDGPSAPTQGLLDILDKYNVKATFFTTSTHGYSNMIAEEYRRGHTVALHTFTHNYATVYASADAYWNDFNQQNEVIHQQTGQYTNLFRFPGGSSNTVSANYTTGIMSTLVQQAADKGYQYFDWNVSSGDAGTLDDTQTFYENIIAGIQKCSANGRPSVVLQHDTKQSSMDAVEMVIQWALDNGYHFERLTINSFPAHHGVNN